MTTPEGKVKEEVKTILDYYCCYYFMPVQTGFGAAGLDFHCVYDFDGFSLAFFIETKAPGKKTTPRQDVLIDRLRSLNVTVFVIENSLGVRRLDQWLSAMHNQKRRSPS